MVPALEIALITKMFFLFYQASSASAVVYQHDAPARISMRVHKLAATGSGGNLHADLPPLSMAAWPTRGNSD
jgi:hypothetical protein